MPINREKRAVAIRVLRQYMSGKISNNELDANWPKDEPELKIIFRECIWFMYSDVEKHYNKRKNKLSPKDKQAIARLILFLGTDQNYGWPAQSLWLNPLIVIAVFSGVIGIKWDWEWAGLFFGSALLFTGLVVNPILRMFSIGRRRKSGDWEVWPFHRIADFAEAKRNPRYLTGRVARN